ncbi:hypothetical protein Dimus_006150, partial [Dionaea muscipula]
MEATYTHVRNPCMPEDRPRRGAPCCPRVLLTARPLAAYPTVCVEDSWSPPWLLTWEEIKLAVFLLPARAHWLHPIPLPAGAYWSHELHMAARRSDGRNWMLLGRWRCLRPQPRTVEEPLVAPSAARARRLAARARMPCSHRRAAMHGEARAAACVDGGGHRPGDTDQVVEAADPPWDDVVLTTSRDTDEKTTSKEI